MKRWTNFRAFCPRNRSRSSLSVEIIRRPIFGSNSWRKYGTISSSRVHRIISSNVSLNNQLQRLGRRPAGVLSLLASDTGCHLHVSLFTFHRRRTGQLHSGDLSSAGDFYKLASRWTTRKRKPYFHRPVETTVSRDLAKVRGVFYRSMDRRIRQKINETSLFEIFFQTDESFER